MKKLLLSILVIISAVFSGFPQKITLGLNLETGTSYRQIMSSHSHISQQVRGTTLDYYVDIESSVTYRVVAKTNHYLDLEVKYDLLELAMQTPAGKFESSSRIQDEHDVFSSVLGELISFPYQLRLDISGRVVNMSNLEEVLQRLCFLHTRSGREIGGKKMLHNPAA
jgi:hypothetical protein